MSGGSMGPKCSTATDGSQPTRSADEASQRAKASQRPGGSQDQSCGSEHSACEAQGQPSDGGQHRDEEPHEGNPFPSLMSAAPSEIDSNGDSNAGRT